MDVSSTKQDFKRRRVTAATVFAAALTLGGCNAASTAIPFLDFQGLKVEGVIESAVAMTVRLKPNRVGLIGGRRTVLSGVHRKAFAAHGIKVEQRIAQPLSGLIESGDISSNKLRAECKRIL